VLHFFLKLYRLRLELTDDAEFFGDELADLQSPDKQRSNLTVSAGNFQLRDVHRLAQFLNRLVYYYLIVERHPSIGECRKVATKLLRELYARDCRRPFCEKGFWEIPEVNGNEELSNLSGYSMLKARKKSTSDELPGHSPLMRDLVHTMPHLFTLQKRVDKLAEFITEDQKGQDRNPFAMFLNEDDEFDDIPMDVPTDKLVVCHRGSEFDDAYQALAQKNLKTLFRIRFVNEHNQIEEGIDGGGLLKEFVTIILKQACDVERGLFIETPQRYLLPNAHCNDSLIYYQFLGKIVGKAIYENILIEPVFSRVFLNQILGRRNGFEELQFLDNNLYKNLLYLKHTREDVSQLQLTFACIESYLGKTVTKDLRENGS
jgi:hypothetical protein